MERSPSDILHEMNNLQKEIVKTYSDELLKARIRIAELEDENDQLRAQLGGTGAKG